MSSKTYLTLPVAPSEYDSVQESTFRKTIQDNLQDIANEILDSGNHARKDASLSLRRFQFVPTATQKPSAGEFFNLNVGGSVVVSSILDEDDMASDSDTALATQQSIKAYIDNSADSGVTQVTAGDGLSTAPSAGITGTGTVSMDLLGLQLLSDPDANKVPFYRYAGTTFDWLLFDSNDFQYSTSTTLSLASGAVGFKNAGSGLVASGAANDTVSVKYTSGSNLIDGAESDDIDGADNILFQDDSDQGIVKRDTVANLPFVNAVAGTAPIVSSGGTGPTISLNYANGLVLSGAQLVFDADDLAAFTATDSMDATDRFVVHEASVGARKIPAAQIPLSIFNYNLTLTAADIGPGVFNNGTGGTYDFPNASKLRFGDDDASTARIQFGNLATGGGHTYVDVISVPAEDELDIGFNSWDVDILGGSVKVNGSAIGTVTSVSLATDSGLVLTGTATVNPTLALKLVTLPLTSDSPTTVDHLVFNDESSPDVTRRIQFTDVDLSSFNNDQGWTNNAGTVTQVDGTGTVNGLTLTGLVTASGSLTLGGTLAVAEDEITDGSILARVASDETITGTYSFTVAPRLNGWLALQNETSANDPTAALAGYQTLYSYNNGSTFELRTIVGADLVRNIPLITGAAGNNQLLVSTGTDHEADWSGTGLVWDGVDTLTATKFSGNGSLLSNISADNLTLNATVTSNTYYPAWVDATTGSGVSTFGDSVLKVVIGATDEVTIAGNLTTDEVDTTTGGLLTGGTQRVQQDGDLVNIKDITATGNWTTTGTGPHSIGAATIGYYQHYQGGTFTSGGGGSAAAGWALGTDLIAANADTAWLTIGAMGGSTFNGSITTQNNSETIGSVSTLYLTEPNIIKGATDTITRAATLYVANAPNEGTDNYAIYVASGDTLVSFLQTGAVQPVSTSTFALGSATKRWGTVYTDDLDLTGEIKTGNGSLTTPGYSFSSNTDSGMYLDNVTPALNFSLDSGLELSLETNQWAFGGSWTNNSATSLDVLQLRNTSGRMGILARTNTSSDFGITHAENDTAFLSRILFENATPKIQFQGSSGVDWMEVSGAGMTVFGQVGIGTTSPSEQLDVVGDVEANSYVFNSNIAVPTTAAATLFNQGSVGPTLSGLNFEVRTGTSPTPSMRVNQNGRVGIGTTSPGKTLDVVGNFRVSTDAVFNSYIDVTGFIYHRSNVGVLNKAQNGWITWATRNTAGSESVIDLSNIGSVNATQFVGGGAGLTGVLADSSTVTDLGANTNTYYPIMADGTSGSVSHFVESSDLFWRNGDKRLEALNLKVLNDLTMASNGDILMGTSGEIRMGASGTITSNTTQTRDKIRVWNSPTYTIGMKNGYTFGPLSGYATSFQMNNTAGRGWWWGIDTHTDAQGAMALNNAGELTVADSIRVGYGTSDTTAHGTAKLDVNGSVSINATGGISDATLHVEQSGSTDIAFFASASSQVNSWIGFTGGSSYENYFTHLSGTGKTVFRHQNNAGGGYTEVGRFTDTGLTIPSSCKITHNTNSTRDKYRLYSSSTYAIGMQSGVTFGALNDWAMTFQFNNDDDRGFWWGDDGHSTAQGAMSLSTAGNLTVADSIRVGYGTSDVAAHGTAKLDVSGFVRLNAGNNSATLGDPVGTAGYLLLNNSSGAVNANTGVLMEGGQGGDYMVIQTAYQANNSGYMRFGQLNSGDASIVETLRINRTNVLAASGGVANPGYGFLSDPDTGIWLNGAGVLSFAVRGTTRFQLDEVGTTTGRYSFDRGQVYNNEGNRITATGNQTLNWDAYNQVDITNVGGRTINIDSGSMIDGGHYCLIVDYSSGSTTDWGWTSTGGTLRWQNGQEPIFSNATVGDQTLITFVKSNGGVLGFWATATV